MEELKHMSRIIRELDLKTARQIVGRQLGKAYFITPHGNLLPLDDDDTNETLASPGREANARRSRTIPLRNRARSLRTGAISK